MNDEKNTTFELEFTAQKYPNYEKISLLMDKVANREKPETISLDLSSLESATDEIQKCMREKIDDNVLELLSKPPGCVPFPSDYGPTMKEYLNTWISGIKGGND